MKLLNVAALSVTGINPRCKLWMRIAMDLCIFGCGGNIVVEERHVGNRCPDRVDRQRIMKSKVEC
jgi:hypothetical protein